jgi:hypothetical protein
MIKEFLSKPLSESFAPARVRQVVEVGTLSKVRKAVGERTDPNNPLAREDRSLFRSDVTEYRYARNADELIKLLAKYDPDVSAGIWNFLRLANSGIDITAVNDKLEPDQKLQRILDNILFRFAGMNNFKDWQLFRPIEMVASTIVKYTLLRGGCGLELVLNKNKTAHKFVIVDPIKVQFKHPRVGEFIPFQKKLDGTESMLDIPTFFWQLLDPDADTPYETPPFLPVIQAVLFNISVMQDLERIVKRTAYPRISVKIVEETLRKFAPVDAQTDDSVMASWLSSQKAAIGSSLSDLAPEDAAVFFDSLEIDVLETKGNTTVDFRPLKSVIDQRIVTGLKSLPTVMGRQFGSSQTIGGVESLLYAKSIASLQEVAAHLLSRSLTLALQLEGKKGFVKVKFKPVSLRPDNELEAFQGLKQARILEQLSLGMITDEQAALELTGNPHLPPGYQKLSGTGFYKNTSNPADSLADRNPTGEEGAGGGRDKTSE